MLLAGSAGLPAAVAEPSLLPSDPALWPMYAAADALRRRRVSSVELTEACLRRIRAYDGRLNAFITRTEDAAMEKAKRSDQRRTRGALSLMDGIPIALKDNIDTAGVRTTAASRIFAHRVPDADAEVTRRLKNAGAVFLGKLNLDEFAFAGTGTTGCYGTVRNPWGLDHIAGGSSAGSAVAVSAGLCFASVGSDDGGSVRIPGSHCGVVGLKTTYGRVSTRGVIPSAYSLDTIGPITRTVRDAALVLSVVAGYDPLDAVTADRPVPDYRKACSNSVRQYRVGVPRDYFFERLHPDVAAVLEKVIRELRPSVAAVIEVKLPRFEPVPNGDYDVELYHYQKQFFDRSPELYHPWSQELLRRVKSVEAVAYVETLRRIRECRRQIREVFGTIDALVLPTMREPAPLLEATVNRTHAGLPSNVSAFNRFGVPAITVPCGLSRDGLPIGCQIVGPAWDDDRILPLAIAVESLAGSAFFSGPPFRQG